MITDLIDLLVDTFNIFGSLVNCLMCRCKDYRRVVQGAVNGTGQEFDDLCSTLPQLPAEASGRGDAGRYFDGGHLCRKRQRQTVSKNRRFAEA